jgi:hypothetical protein
LLRTTPGKALDGGQNHEEEQKGQAQQIAEVKVHG